VNVNNSNTLPIKSTFSQSPPSSFAMHDDRRMQPEHDERTQPDRLPAWPQSLGANSSNNELDQSASSRITQNPKNPFLSIRVLAIYGSPYVQSVVYKLKNNE
jgi:hypothetical protein